MRTKKSVYRETPDSIQRTPENLGCYGCELLEKCATTREDKDPGVCEELYKNYHSLRKI